MINKTRRNKIRLGLRLVCCGIAASMIMTGCGNVAELSMAENNFDNNSQVESVEPYTEPEQSQNEDIHNNSSQVENDSFDNSSHIESVESHAEPEQSQNEDIHNNSSQANDDSFDNSSQVESVESHAEPEQNSDVSENVANHHFIENVPIIAQMPDYPTGCEAVSTVMVMRYWGEDVTVDEFIDDYLDKSSDFYTYDGKNYGPDPNEHFLGDPRSKASYGCYAPVIEKALNKYYDGDAIVSNMTGTSLRQLCSDYIDNDIPVIVWVSINMLKPKYTSIWYLPNGEKYQWLNNEHCMVLTGYDDDYYYFNDPYSGNAMRYEKQLAESRFDAFDKQSIVVEK